MKAGYFRFVGEGSATSHGLAVERALKHAAAQADHVTDSSQFEVEAVSTVYTNIPYETFNAVVVARFEKLERQERP